ncbi:universal stress protein [Halomicrobium salinisoli]|uniref:universal stress protein n=1 Tax=Halomicrobium salinisoli TaxID=2878391 RepID=UPI001CF00B85|nr:universal stress protein [Halomicrobium salinisoli]
MEVDLVLAPVDGSDRSERAVEYALAVADAYGADMHLLFVLEETLVEAIDAGEVEAESIASEHREIADGVRERIDGDDTALTYSTAAGFSQRRLAQSPGSVILDVAEEIDADFVVVPRESASTDPEEAIGKAALYVIEYASQPVLSV